MGLRLLTDRVLKRNLIALRTRLLSRAGFVRFGFARQQMAKNLTLWKEVLLHLMLDVN